MTTEALLISLQVLTFSFQVSQSPIGFTFFTRPHRVAKTGRFFSDIQIHDSKGPLMVKRTSLSSEDLSKHEISAARLGRN